MKDVKDRINTLIRCCQQQTRLIANELTARPTYAEEFQSLKDNMKRVVAPNDDGTFSEIESRLSRQHSIDDSRSFQLNLDAVSSEHRNSFKAVAKSRSIRGSARQHEVKRVSAGDSVEHFQKLELANSSVQGYKKQKTDTARPLMKLKKQHTVVIETDDENTEGENTRRTEEEKDLIDQ